MANLELRLALKGDLEKAMKREAEAIARAVTRAVREAGVSAQQQWRTQLRRGNISEKLMRTIRVRSYPSRGQSASPAAVIYSKAPKIMASLVRSLTIKSANGTWLAIPTDAAPKKGFGSEKISPKSWPDHKYGPLRFVYRKTGPSLLVVDNQRARKGKRGGFIKASSKGIERGEVATVVMFILVRQVRTRKVIDLARIEYRATQQMARLAARYIQQEGDSIGVRA